MTGRQDVPSVKTEPGLKSLTSPPEEVAKYSSKQGKRSATSSKSTKPTLEIYRPPSMYDRNYADRNGHKNGTKVHFQMGNVGNKATSPPSSSTELKSALKRSKSFTANDASEITSNSFEKDAFPVEYQGLIRSAKSDPNLLSCQKLMELVRLICCKAVESFEYSVSAAELCFTIIEKEHNHTFLESLLNCCREWYNDRDKVLRTPIVTHPGVVIPGSRRWTAYVSFLTELFLRVKSHYCQAVQAQLKGSSGNMPGPHPNSPMAHFALTLLTLLYECLNIILKPPSLNNIGEIECLRTMLTTVGKQLEHDAPHRMQQVLVPMRDAFINPSINAQIRKILLEVVELHASNWQLDLPQMMYYFPYTNFNRK